VTPTLSVLAVQVRLIWVLEAAVPVKPAGTEGGVVSASVLLAAHCAVVPPFNPAHDHFQGPVPATVEAVPAVQRFVVGADNTVVPLADPHEPFTTTVTTPTLNVVCAVARTFPFFLTLTVTVYVPAASVLGMVQLKVSVRGVPATNAKPMKLLLFIRLPLSVTANARLSIVFWDAVAMAVNCSVCPG
jgi:hypothetical protein